MDENDLKNKLSSEEYHVTQEKGTEAPFANKYWDNHKKGMYMCKVCGKPLFDSDHKFDSGTGWPSYDQPVAKDAVLYNEDTTHGMNRIEAVCKNCGAHLGHVFEDGPEETTGLRYCINSASLDFKEE
jgi:peptide-methionine (R)-S-oxide reductase